MQVRLKLYFVDFAGKVIDNVRFKQTGDKAAVDTEVLQSGIYLLDVTTKLGLSRIKSNYPKIDF